MARWTSSRDEMETGRLASSIYWMDLDRAKFLLRSYLRVRLHKLEAHVMHAVLEKRIFNRLSKAEQDYALEYVNIVEAHMKRSVLDALPSNYRSLLQQMEEQPEEGDGAPGELDMIDAPDLTRHVFARIKEDRTNVAVDGDDLDLAKDSLYIIRYELFRGLLEEGSVELV